MQGVCPCHPYEFVKDVNFYEVRGSVGPCLSCVVIPPSGERGSGCVDFHFRTGLAKEILLGPLQPSSG